jgi:hypothetical protein
MTNQVNFFSEKPPDFDSIPQHFFYDGMLDYELRRLRKIFPKDDFETLKSQRIAHQYINVVESAEDLLTINFTDH